MAGYAILGSRFIKQDILGPNFFEELVTFAALHVLVGPPQREGSPFLVIKQGRLPLNAVVAVGAGCRLPFGELLSVCVLVAVFTQQGGGLEVDVR